MSRASYKELYENMLAENEANISIIKNLENKIREQEDIITKLNKKLQSTISKPSDKLQGIKFIGGYFVKNSKKYKSVQEAVKGL
jgi:tetrahydromethanopterin S-methyltransferase subunit F